MGLGDEAEEARARLDAEAAAEDQRRRANWAAIDKLVQEFVANAVERQVPAHGGVFKKFWRYGALILSCECQKRIIM